MAREVPVGCVFVDNRSGEIVARGFNRTNELYNVSFVAYTFRDHQMIDHFNFLAPLRPLCMQRLSVLTTCTRKHAMLKWKERMNCQNTFLLPI